MTLEEPIIVCVKHKGGYRWFRSERDYWVLDQEKWARAFAEAGCDDDGGEGNDYSERFGIPVVNAETTDEFLDKMTPFLVSREELTQSVLVASQTAESWFDIAPWLPALFVNFDDECLLSIHSESPAFEDYVPAGWTGAYDDFLDVIPFGERYWIVEGADLSTKFQE